MLLKINRTGLARSVRSEHGPGTHFKRFNSPNQPQTSLKKMSFHEPSEPKNVPSRAQNSISKSWTDLRPKYIHRTTNKPFVVDAPFEIQKETEKQESLFQELPTELVIHILSHVDAKTLSRSIPLVNRRLYFISNDDGCWKTAFLRYFSTLPSRRLATIAWFGSGAWSWQKEYVARIRHLASWGTGTVNLPNPYGEGDGQIVKQSRVGGVQLEARFGNDARGLGSVDRLSMVPLGNVLLAGCIERGLVCLADPVNGKLTSRDVVLVNQTPQPAETRMHLAANDDGQPMTVSCMALDATGFVAMGSPVGGVLVHYGHVTQPAPNHPVFKTNLPNVPLTHPRWSGNLPASIAETLDLPHAPHAPLPTTALTWQMREKGTATHPSWLVSGGGINDGMVYLWNTSKLPTSHAVACFTTHQPSNQLAGIASLHVDEVNGYIAAVLMKGCGLAVWRVDSWKQTLSNPSQALTAQPPLFILDWNHVFLTESDWTDVDIFALFHAPSSTMVVSSNLEESVKKRRDSVCVAAIDLNHGVVWRGLNGHQHPFWSERSSCELPMPLSSRITSMAWDKVPGEGVGRRANGRVYPDQVSLCGYGDEFPEKSTIVTGDEIGRICVWNFLSKQCIFAHQLSVLKRAIQEYRVLLRENLLDQPPFSFQHAVTFLHIDAGKLVSAQVDSVVRVRDVLTGTVLRELSTGNHRRWQDGEDHHSTPTSMLVTGSRIIVGTKGGSIKTWIAWGLERMGSWNLIPKKHSGSKKMSVSSPASGLRGEAALSLREHLEDHYDAMREGQQKRSRMARINGGFNLDQGWNDDELEKYVLMVSLEEERERQAILDVVRAAESQPIMPRHMAINNRQHVVRVDSDPEEEHEDVPPHVSRHLEDDFDPLAGPEQLGSSYHSSHGSSPTPVPFLQRRVGRTESTSSFPESDQGTPRSRRTSKSEWTTLRFGSGAASGMGQSPRTNGVWGNLSLPRSSTNEKVTSVSRRDLDRREEEEDEELLYVLELSKVDM